MCYKKTGAAFSVCFASTALLFSTTSFYYEINKRNRSICCILRLICSQQMEFIPSVTMKRKEDFAYGEAYNTMDEGAIHSQVVTCHLFLII